MNRLGQADIHAEPVKAIFEGPLKGKAFNAFKSMAQSPAALNTYLGMAGALEKTGLSAAEREVIQLVIGQANSCGYCLSAHTAIGKMVGLSEDQTIEARKGHMTNPKHQALVRFALAIHEKRGHIADSDLSAFLAAGYSQGHAAEVVAVYALATFTNYFNHVNDTAIDFPAIKPL